MLKAEKIDLALLEAKYGFVTPPKVLQALQRDAIQGKADGLQEDIYERPMLEVPAVLYKIPNSNNRVKVQVSTKKISLEWRKGIV